MVDYDAWVGGSALTGDTTTPQAARRAAAAWRRIQAKPMSITIRRNGQNLPAQTVRIEYNNSAVEEVGGTGKKGVITVTLFGIQGHATLADTNLKTGDRFVHNSQEFEVIQVIDTLGERQAVCEKRGG